MTSFEKIYFSTFGLIAVLSLSYWGILAWFYPDKLKHKLMERARKRPDWLFMKGYSLRFSDEHGISMMRFTTLVGTLMLLIVALIIVLKGVR
jgi:hypothetical protein